MSEIGGKHKGGKLEGYPVVSLAGAFVLAYGVHKFVGRDFVANVLGTNGNGASKGNSLVKFGPQWLILLSVSSLWLINKSRRELDMTPSERMWLETELSQRRERLEDVLNGVKNGKGTDEIVDVSYVLDTIDELAQFLKTDPLVEQGLLVAADAVSRNIKLHMGEQGCISTEQAEFLNQQLEYEKDVVNHAQKYGLDLADLRSCMLASSNAARRALQIRFSGQISKALTILSRAKSQLPYMAISVVLSIVHGSIYALRAHYMANLMSLVYKKLKDSSATGRSVIGTVRLLFLLELLGLLSNFVGTKTKALGTRQFIVRLKTDLFRSLISQDVAYFEQHDLFQVRSIIGGCDFVCSALVDFPINSVQNVSSIVSSCLLLWSRSRKLFLALAALLPLRLFVTEMLTEVQYRLEAKVSTPYVSNFKDIWGVLVDPVGLITLRSFARERLETAMFSQSLKSMDRAQDRGAMLYSVFDMCRTLVESSVEIGALWYGSVLGTRHELDVASLPSYTSTANHAFEQSRILYYACSNLVSSDGIFDSAEKIYDLLHSKPNIGIDFPPIDDMPRDDSVLPWGVEFHDVEFSYPTRPSAKILQGISFTIEEGERVGVLGESGCGKSTIIGLLLRLYSPTQGRIHIAGMDTRKLNALWLRKRISVVSQTVYLPFRTVKENLMYGLFDRQYTETELEEQLRAALRLARCEDLFFDKRRFPHQWHTDIGRNGVKLSGGERQRLCIARAILTKPKILILDEATSALDEESQYQVQEAIQTLHDVSSGRLTIISIAHRLSNFRHVDKLIVLDNGHIVEQGTPAMLSQIENGVFANFVKRSTLDFSEKQDIDKRAPDLLPLDKVTGDLGTAPSL
mmetsp:Transcript_10338/g.19316  ORF Transcript_10338/g.19316 Transcript_10338/m.19316 type:complete len:857 (+) Transcript_10338:141-2711(+)|eukprot:CAMPEP_0203761938 /NCGR_PEP_ID=MMETSP0098-20131031/14925_1 /ASSEMBLY_ACC=CAM_ASM_000208 /TAXON_ID=96639 /ORGANISM=" , Strain NY0313808BC1" /LENGTH=856 /DNA_ID=CAMNT_0050656139 /DNA_START=116 /DNA_END=2686 /DNA_ORIENTATION=-